MICAGSTGYVCFFDSLTGSALPPSSAGYWTSQLVGGESLDGNGQGVCSGCHAGRNPAVVHPSDPVFMLMRDRINLDMVGAWHEPIVPSGWPENPGPLMAMPPPGAGEGSCYDNCHGIESGGAAKLPLFWQIPPELFCQSVLEEAVDDVVETQNGMPVVVGRTMPDGGDDFMGGRVAKPPLADFDHHVKWVRRVCADPGSSVGTVEIDPPTPVTAAAPTIEEPVYACATEVFVSGALAGTTLEIWEVGGIAPMASTSVASADTQRLGPVTLTHGMILEAKVILGTAPPVSSASAEVQPPPQSGPRPRLARPIHECATHIGVFKERGATVRITHNGTALPDVTSNDNWAILPLDQAVSSGDDFTAEQDVCGSGFGQADTQMAGTVPTTIPVPVFRDARAGQDLVTVSRLTTGAMMSLLEQSTSSNLWSHPSFPFSSVTFDREVKTTDRYVMEQTVCGVTHTTLAPEGHARDCGSGPEPPEIVPPFDGDTYLVVADAVPGAVYHVWVNGALTVSGTGSVIHLGAPLAAGDLVTVSKDLGTCRGSEGVNWIVQP